MGLSSEWGKDRGDCGDQNEDEEDPFAAECLRQHSRRDLRHQVPVEERAQHVTLDRLVPHEGAILKYTVIF